MYDTAVLLYSYDTTVRTEYGSNACTPEELFLNACVSFEQPSRLGSQNLRRYSGDNSSPLLNIFPRVLGDRRPHELLPVQDTTSQTPLADSSVLPGVALV